MLPGPEILRKTLLCVSFLQKSRAAQTALLFLRRIALSLPLDGGQNKPARPDTGEEGVNLTILLKVKCHIWFIRRLTPILQGDIIPINPLNEILFRSAE